nr:hypothetical protein [Tanacetum cinerariifolium]
MQGRLFRICVSMLLIEVKAKCKAASSGYVASNLRRFEAAWCYGDIYNDLSDALKKFALLEELSLYSEEAIETAGSYCPMLRTLKVNQRAIDYSGEGCEEMAMAIGKYLSELRYLELIGDSMSDFGLKAILDGCRHLESLDLCDCLNIDLKGDMVKICSQQIKYLKVSKDSDEPYDYENDIRFGATTEPRLHISDEESYNGSSDDDDEYYDDDDYDDDDDDGYDDDDGDLMSDLDRSMAGKENDTKDMSSECIKAGPCQT